MGQQDARERRGAVSKSTLRITSAELTAAATTQAFNMPDMPPEAVIVGMGIDVATAFDDGGAGVFVADVGNAGDPDSLIAAADIETVGATSTPRGVELPGGPALAGPYTLTIGAGGVNVNTAIAGELVASIYFVV